MRGIVPVTEDEKGFAALTSEVMLTVAASSQRVYDHTYQRWQMWCREQRVSPMDLRPANVSAFLSDQPVTKKTRQRMLSAIRKLVTLYVIALPDMQPLLHALQLMKVPGNAGGQERSRYALSPESVYRVLNVWSGQDLLSIRNRALIAVLFTTGLRRAEAAALQWRDVDLEEGVITVRHGKGDKERQASIFGNEAIGALQAWQRALPNRQFVFPSFDRKLQPGFDAPTDGQTVYRVVKRTEKLSGVQFTPHTARRTLITEVINQGMPVPDAQAQAGHADPSTTLGYAQPTDARQRRKKVRLRYGD